jgi:toxin ParE1/3/4
VARIELAAELSEDFDRIFEHLAAYDATTAAAGIRGIVEAISVLEHNPLIGRLARGENRELIVGRRRRGYVVLYRYIESMDTVFVLAVRAQREAGYSYEAP